MNKSVDLNKRLAYLEQANLFKMMALDLAKELGDFNSSISQLDGPAEIFNNCQERAIKIIPFKQTSFFLVREADSEFYPYLHYPAGIEVDSIKNEVELLIEDGTFSRAVMTKEPVTAYTEDFSHQLLLHVLATASRVRGMFVGLLETKSKHMQEASFELFSILMAHCANALESFELYQQLKESNARLHDKVEQLSLSESCLKDEIIQHEKTEAALEASERRYRLLAETAREMIFVISNDKNVVYANPSAIQTCGYEIEEMISLHVSDLFEDFNYPDDSDSQDNLQTQTVNIKSKVGGKIPLEINIVPIAKKDEETDFLLVGRDIRKRLEAEKERQELESRLWQAQKMESIGLLASGIAHDFSNLISIIGNYTALSMKKMDQENPLFSNLEKVKIASDRAVNLAQQFYTIGKTDKHNRVEINLISAILEIFGLLKSSIGSRVVLETDFKADPLWVLAEKTRIQQVLINLITNAGHALKGREGTIKITTDLAVLKKAQSMQILELAPGKFAKISVQDNGSGIDEAIIDRVFDPYFSTKKDKGNSGLGLSMVHGIVKNYKGAVDIQTRAGMGTVFDVYLPAVSDS